MLSIDELCMMPLGALCYVLYFAVTHSDEKINTITNILQNTNKITTKLINNNCRQFKFLA